MSIVNATTLFLPTVNYSTRILPTNSTKKPYDKPFSIYIVVIVWLLFFLACVIGNGLVCATVYRNRKMRTPTNTLLVNLAASDIMMAVCSSLAVVDFIVKDVYAGEFLMLYLH